MTRRQWWKLMLIGGALALGAVVAESAEDDPPGTPTPIPGVVVADLEQQLRSGLKARRPEEFEFITMVVLKVKSKELSIALVQSTFLWARRHQPYPFPYFERGLRERAAREGILL